MKADSGHPIQVAARRSGVSPDVIRAWERRYGAVVPVRTSTNRRLYTDKDVERLYLLAQVTRAGRRIGDVAALSLEALRAMADEDRRAQSRVGSGGSIRPQGLQARQHLDACIDAVARLDAPAFEAALSGASLDLGPTAILDQLLAPLMAEIGKRWRNGTMRVAQEHMATAVVRSFLGTLQKGRPAAAAAPKIVVGTPAGQAHELGGLTVSLAAALDGWAVTYLGADLPAAEIALAVRDKQARAVAISIVYPADDPHLVEELRSLGEHLTDGVALIVGGGSAAAYGEVLDEIGARVLVDLSALRAELATLRQAPPT